MISDVDVVFASENKGAPHDSLEHTVGTNYLVLTQPVLYCTMWAPSRSFNPDSYAQARRIKAATKSNAAPQKLSENSDHEANVHRARPSPTVATADPKETGDSDGQLNNNSTRRNYPEKRGRPSKSHESRADARRESSGAEIEYGCIFCIHPIDTPFRYQRRICPDCQPCAPCVPNVMVAHPNHNFELVLDNPPATAGPTVPKIRLKSAILAAVTSGGRARTPAVIKSTCLETPPPRAKHAFSATAASSTNSILSSPPQANSIRARTVSAPRSSISCYHCRKPPVGTLHYQCRQCANKYFCDCPCRTIHPPRHMFQAIPAPNREEQNKRGYIDNEDHDILYEQQEADDSSDKPTLRETREPSQDNFRHLDDVLPSHEDSNRVNLVHVDLSDDDLDYVDLGRDLEQDSETDSSVVLIFEGSPFEDVNGESDSDDVSSLDDSSGQDVLQSPLDIEILLRMQKELEQNTAYAHRSDSSSSNTHESQQDEPRS
ncbi:hypothetical protein CIB48_g10804 [Xylaria polymorpha]|nr:hypothetical protein CIB48_g10804 [Xylaria polymorpha]